MYFTHTPYQPGQTIAAVATPPGEGGVAVIRISGKEAITIAKKIFSGPVERYASHTAHYGQIYNSSHERVDDVLLMPFLGGRSYTGEETVEIFCHGGSLVTRRVLETVLAAGARAALPGEFTFQAFMNGKMDLAQAEAVQALIGAKNTRALEAAESQLEGVLSEKVRTFQKQIAHIAAILEAWVDFPDEGLEFISMEALIEQIEEIRLHIEGWAKTFYEGKIVHEGLLLCLVGAPNVGKSSLMNVLVEKERAIVSDIPGTTRDLVEETIRFDGLHVKIVDTAGIRISSDWVEQEGMRRAQQAVDCADLVLCVMDAHNPSVELLETLPKEKTVLVWNKIDLMHGELSPVDFPHIAAVSALKRQGIEGLKEVIRQVIWRHGAPSKEEVVITHIRHKEAVDEAALCLAALVDGLKQGISPEFVSIEAKGALLALGKIIGTHVTEEVLTAIFSTFCVGK